MRVSSQRGFTLVELLVSIFLSGIVATAALTMLTRAQRAERDIAHRSEATSTGRLTIEAMGRSLRSMTCLPDGTRPILAASDDSISYYADLDNDQSFDPEKWRLSAVRTNGSLTGILEERWVGVATPVADTVAPTKTRVLATNISSRVNGATTLPLFAYAAYTNNASETPTPLPAGTVAAGDLQRIAQIDIGFSSNPVAKRRSGRDVTSYEETSIYARTIQRNGDNNLPTFDCTGS